MEFKTISGPAEAALRERSSKFLAYAYPVEDEAQVRERLESLRKHYFNATHHCYAWRMGAGGEATRANDDGEPSGTAGLPILGQIVSAGLTYVLVVVVRYFGGTKLGVPGLIAAYRGAARQVLEEAVTVEKAEMSNYKAWFGYEKMNDVMRVSREMQARVGTQGYEEDACTICLAVRKEDGGELVVKMGKYALRIEHLGEGF